MKTYLDFNLQAIKKTMAKTFLEKGKKLSERELEALLSSMMKDKENIPPISVPCLTCGKAYPLNQLEHDCQEEDIWLFKYISSSQGTKEIPRGYKGNLRAKYPLLHRKAMVFRGINFDTKEQYDSFMAKVSGGTYLFPHISSWTLDFSKAVSFARFVMKGTRETEDVRRRALMKMIEEKANITGYKGVILGTNVTKGMTLCDISQEGIGGMDEEEIILLPGNHTVTIIKEIDRIEGLSEWNLDISNIEEILEK